MTRQRTGILRGGPTIIIGEDGFAADYFVTGLGASSLLSLLLDEMLQNQAGSESGDATDPVQQPDSQPSPGVPEED